MYRKVPRDLTEATLSEFLTFSKRQWSSEMFIDESRTEEKIQINLDVMGSHEVDAHGNLYKERLTSKGDVIAKEEVKTSHYGASSGLSRHYSFNYDNQDVDRIRNMVHSGEGCRVAGNVKVNKVPGNVHLSTYSHSYLFGSLYQETKNSMNITHKINHISFGTDTDITYVKTNFEGTGAVSPLDGVHQLVSERKSGTSIDSAIFEYYTKVVPTTYIPLEGPQIQVYQFTANTNKIANQQMPSLYLRYDFSPVTVQYKETKETASHFAVQICAVIGGIFTMAGLVDSVLHKSIANLAQKAQVGKLG